jgi:hypothetical protein
MDEQD